MKNYFFRCLRKPISILIFIIALNSEGKHLLNAGGLFLNEMEIDSSTKSDENNSSLPTNPFEVLEMIRRANSLNDATEPSDAIDDALNSFIMIDKKEKL
tara:strand:+ start:3199 stop:3495 length:297 start_codon:yes stop_codon:yes gene_type:complete